MLEDAVIPHRSLKGSRLLTVCCPLCRRATVMRCPVLVLHVALNTWNQMNLYAACCNVYWGASEEEIRDIKESLRAEGTGYRCVEYIQ